MDCLARLKDVLNDDLRDGVFSESGVAVSASGVLADPLFSLVNELRSTRENGALGGFGSSSPKGSRTAPTATCLSSSCSTEDGFQVVPKGGSTSLSRKLEFSDVPDFSSC